MINLILLFLLLISTSHSQTFKRELNGIPFSDSEGNILNVFSGGTNNLEHQFIDIDSDGDLDIFYLDSDGTYGWYENTGNAFLQNYVLSFDSIPGFKLKNWFYFVDIDNDSDFDLFTGGESNFIEFRKNLGSVSTPYFKLEVDTLKDNEDNPIFSEFSSNPLFADVDGDGDFDFISGNSVGTLTFYENIGSVQSFSFKFITNSWQDIIIISGGNPLEKKLLHGASSVVFADIDNDGDLDLFWGDFFSRSLYFIQNIGTAANPQMKRVYDFYPPNSDSILTSGFNSPRFADVDNDGDLDMFVSVLFDPTVPQSLLFYRNDGDKFNPNFKKITDNFLKTLDMGTQSVPALIDIDNDGDEDLFIGNTKNPNGSIAFFENSGTKSNPQFLLIDSTYFGIDGELSLAPAFGDIDGDQDFDLVVGNFDGTISFYKNIGTKNLPNFSYQNKIANQDSEIIDIGNFARPLLIDFDNDNDLDLVVGKFNGKISLYKNIGNSASPIFQEDLNYFAGIDVGDNSAPFLIDFDQDSELDLFIGNREGKIFYFKNNGNNLLPNWNLETENFLGESFGSEAVPFFADIDDDSDKDIFISNVKGGLYFFRNQTVTDINKVNNIISPESFTIKAYPNPFNLQTTIILSSNEKGNFSVKIFNTLGEQISEIFHGELEKGNYFFSWDGTNDNNKIVSSGNYIISVTGINISKSVNIILLK
ncbi:MAG: FG-GAP-like repeat-containing protein [Ignavibacteriaceae bacterium]